MKPIAILQHQSNEDEGFIREWIEQNDLTAETWRLWEYCEHEGLDKQQRLENSECHTRLGSPDKYSAVIVLGGEANVRDTKQLNWMQQEISWLRSAVACSTPIVGICLGAQLMAHILGAEVVKLDVAEKGVFSLELNQQFDSFLNQPSNEFKRSLNVIQAHSYRFDVPNDCILLASTQVCKQQMFYSQQQSIFGIQCHLEWSREKAIQLFPDEPSYLEMNALDEKMAKRLLFQILNKMIPNDSSKIGKKRRLK